MEHKYFLNQRGAGGMPVFYGSRYQRGMGLGSMFKSFFRWISPIVKTHAVPVLKDAAKFVGTEAVKTATNIAADAIEGKAFNESVKDRAKETIENLGEKVTSLVQKGGQEKDYIKRRKEPQKRKAKKFQKFKDIFGQNEFNA